MHTELGYSLIGDKSIWKLTWSEIRVCLEGLRVINERKYGETSGETSEFESRKRRIKKRSNQNARERFKQSRGLA